MGSCIADANPCKDEREEISHQAACIAEKTLDGVGESFCFSFTMSPTIILKGCMAILMEVSRNISDTSPKIMAVLTAMPKLPALGSRHMTSTATNEPINR